MLFWVGKIVLFSILFIYLLHSIFLFLSNTLTIPKTKDLVQITNDNYKNIYDMLSKKQEDEFENLTRIDSLPNNSSINNSSINNSSINDDMKSELAHYLRNQLNE